MKEDLLPYYEHELSFVRHMGKEFARQYSKIASRLLLEPDKCDDPHVERLIEAFALLAGRVHHKIDDEFPEITEALLNIHYPHYLRPLPPMTIAQLRLDSEQGKVSGEYRVEAGTEVYASSSLGRDASCSFRTCYPVSLWPLEVRSASAHPAASVRGGSVPGEAFAAIEIGLGCLAGARLAELEIDRLRFYLNGESNIVHILYELLFVNAFRAVVRGVDANGRLFEAPLPAGAIREAGFAKDEGILPYPDRSFLGYRLLQEYFSYPQKFLFFDLCGLSEIDRSRFGESFSILIYLTAFERKQRLQQLTQNVGRETFALGCTPIVNLFGRTAEPIRLTHRRAEYKVVADIHRPNATEIYSIDQVSSYAPYFEKPREFSPFYSTRHAYDADPEQAFWYATRRRSERPGDAGSEVYLTLVDLGFNPALPPVETLTVRVTCTNRDIAGLLPFTGEFGELSMETGSLVRVRALMAATRTVRPPLRRGLQWRQISHLALNHLSITGDRGEALQEILKLYDFTEDPAIRRQIAGISAVHAKPRFARVISEQGVNFVQGMGVEIEFDEDEYVGAGVFLLAAVLERFLSLYSAINSFSQLTATTRQRKEPLKRWPPRSGQQVLL